MRVVPLQKMHRRGEFVRPARVLAVEYPAERGDVNRPTRASAGEDGENLAACLPLERQNYARTCGTPSRSTWISKGPCWTATSVPNSCSEPNVERDTFRMRSFTRNPARDAGEPAATRLTMTQFGSASSIRQGGNAYVGFGRALQVDRKCLRRLLTVPFDDGGRVVSC